MKINVRLRPTYNLHNIDSTLNVSHLQFEMQVTSILTKGGGC